MCLNGKRRERADMERRVCDAWKWKGIQVAETLAKSMM